MKRSNICMLAILAGTSVAMAAPRESFNLGAMTSDNKVGGAGNSVLTFNALGSDGGGSYTCRSITLTATLGAQGAGSLTYESRFLVTPPGGTPFVVQPASANNATAGTVFTVTACPVDTAVTTAGAWRVESYDSYDDGVVDMVWSAVNVTLNDSSPVVPSVVAGSNFSSSFTLVPSDGTTTANSGTATDAQRTRTMTLPAGTTINKVLFSGFVTTLTHLDATNTTTQYTPQTRVRVTSPIGTVVTVTPVLSTATSGTGMTNATGGVTGGTNVGGLITVPIASQDSGGTWTFLFYESTNDLPGAAVGSSPAFAGIDSVWDRVNIGLSGPTAPTNPVVSAGACTPNAFPNNLSGTSRVMTVAVAPATNPASATTSVTANLTALGGPANAVFLDDGVFPDTAIDGTYTYAGTVSAAGGAYTVTVNAQSADARSGSGTITVNVASFEDLGDFSTGSHAASRTVAERSIPNWFKVVLPAVDSSGAGYVDIWCEPTSGPGNPIAAGNSLDPDLALYDAAGTKITTDDLDGPGFWAQLSYGSTASRGINPTWGTEAPGVARNGYDGALAGGVYYIAQGHYNMGTSGNNFGAVVGTPGGNVVVKIETLDNTGPSNPSLGTVVATPAAGTGGTPVVITVPVTPGNNPPSTGLLVTANLSSLGGSASAGMNDAGLNGDATAGDGIYTVATSIPAGATDFSTYAVTVDAIDDQSRSALQRSVTITGQATALDEATLSGGDAGDSLATAGMFSGSGAINAIVGSTTNTAGGDAADVYKIQICDEAAFVADTRLVAGDTQLFLFDSNGMGVVSNDDTIGLSARLDSTLVTANGVYYLGVTRYNVDAFDATPALIWTTQAGQAAPAATAGALAGWSAATAATSQGAYRVSLAGVCFPAPAQCSPADVGIQGGGPGHDRLLNNNDFIAFIDLFFANDPAADLGSQGGVQGADGQWNNNDFIVFIDYFFNDSALCQG